MSGSKRQHASVTGENLIDAYETAKDGSETKEFAEALRDAIFIGNSTDEANAALIRQHWAKMLERGQKLYEERLKEDEHYDEDYDEEEEEDERRI